MFTLKKKNLINCKGDRGHPGCYRTRYCFHFFFSTLQLIFAGVSSTLIFFEMMLY